MKLLALAEKYNYTCVYCHKKFPIEQLTRDHYYPRSVTKAGKRGEESIVLACNMCNISKADLNPYYFKYKL